MGNKLKVAGAIFIISGIAILAFIAGILSDAFAQSVEDVADKPTVESAIASTISMFFFSMLLVTVGFVSLMGGSEN
ncbi:MAG: hypothetical protein HY364_04525 [Candidatus Aenigmarchaeota archaeon]|nr:hypothetical protein [Candidatus Aenigmarchaeota archaeon]